MRTLRFLFFILVLSAVSTDSISATSVVEGRIVVGDKASELEQYAAKELQRYLYQLSEQMLPVVSDSEPIDKPSFMIGREKTNKIIKTLRKSGKLPVWEDRSRKNIPSETEKWGYIGSETKTNAASPALAPHITDPDPMESVPYHEERSNVDGYVFTVPNGTYKVELYFSDMTSSEPAQRVFGIYAEDKCAKESLDLFYEVGSWKPFDLKCEGIEVADGQLDIHFKRLIGEPTVSAISVEGDGYSLKVNCGGARHGAWVADQAQPGTGPVEVTPQQGFVLKNLDYEGRPALCIAGNDAEGVLYGVYTLLSEYYGVGFYMSGDVLPADKVELTLPEVDDHGAPKQKIRGFLPWTNFPQSATSYSFEDYRYVIDQIARMRMNFLFIHDYTGTAGHNEMFTNIDHNGIFERVWFSTLRSGHHWRMPGWEIIQYPFNSYDLFEDYDFGSDAAAHNETLNNREVFAKGVSLFQRVIAYAHKRGVKIGLGVDIDSFPAYYGVPLDDPGLSKARADQIIRDYPNLDYFIAFRKEGLGEGASHVWDNIFRVIYKRFKTKAPQTRLAVSGWGIHGNTIDSIPNDVVISPIAPYSAACATGAEYPKHEYWGIPWLERDFKSSVWFYPYRCDLSQTIGAYQRQNSNMNGFLCLTWRIAGVIDPKLSYIAQAPWDSEGKLASSEVLYRQYAAKCYGAEVADAITEIINQNEPFAPDGSESNHTYKLSGVSRPGEIAKAQEQLNVIDSVISTVQNPENKRRLQILRARIESTKLMNELDAAWPGLTWETLPYNYDKLTGCFDGQVEDISSLGNLVSFSNRLTQGQYMTKVNSFRKSQPIQAPSYVRARGTRKGALITWRNEEPTVAGFHVYRDGNKISADLLPAQANLFEDTDAAGEYLYSVRAVAADGKESPLSVPSRCFAGKADVESPHIVVISPPITAVKGRHIDITARMLDNRSYDSISAVLFYRHPGASGYKQIQMKRRCKAVFGVRVGPEEITNYGIEYYIEVSDGDNTGFYPAAAPAAVAFVTLDTHPVEPKPGKVEKLICDHQVLRWTPADGNVHLYNLYRSQEQDFSPGPDNYLTYAAAGTTSFKDAANDYWDRPKQGTYYYRVAAVNKSGIEGNSSPECSVNY